MDIVVRPSDSFRVIGDHKGNNFIDVSGVHYDSMAIDLYSHFHYIEVRKKESSVRVFTFPKKSYKKDYDFGWWADAEVVYSLNEQTMNK